MSLALGVIMDPIDSITPYKDSTLAMMLEAQRRGWTLYYLTPEQLYLHHGLVRATVQKARVKDDNDDWYELAEKEDISLTQLDIVLVRQDPPVDRDYLYCTYLLDQAVREGVFVSNHPSSIRDCNEKLFATQFQQCTVPTVVTSDVEQLRAFVAEHKDTIMKPLDGMGGSNIFRVKEGDPNFAVITEVLTEHGTTPTMIQRYIPAITEGDKRILMINGEPVNYALARIPMAGETRGNIAAGGSGEGRELTENDRWICEQVGPVLKEKGLHFVGLDVIGDYLTEINVTSPTCIRELDAIYGINIASDLLDFLESQLDH